MRRLNVLTLLTITGLMGWHSRGDAQQAEREAGPVWTVLEPVKLVSSGGSTLTRQPDDSILASGKHPDPDTYTITAHTKLTGITAIRLELVPDASFGNRGPGRAFHGNLVLNELRLTAAPQKDPTKAMAVVFHKATADYSQPDYHVTAAIDGKPETAWAIWPQPGKKHAGIFEAKTAFGYAEGTVLTFELDQNIGVLQHGIGRFRLSVTTRQPPLPLELLELSPKDLDIAWADLAGPDAGKAQLTIEALVLSRQCVGFLKDRLKARPVKVDAKRVAELVEQLDHDKFSVASGPQELEKLGHLAAPALAHVLLESTMPEGRRRAAKLMEKIRNSPGLLRDQRGVEVLVRLGTTDARQLLTVLAKGPPEAWLTQEAKAGINRLAK